MVMKTSIHFFSLRLTKRAVQRHAVWCIASYFAQKRSVADSTHKQRANDLYKSRWKSWRLTNHSAKIVVPVLRHGFWLENLQGRKSLSCINFFFYKFNVSRVFFLGTCTKKRSKRVRTISDKIENKTVKKMKSVTTKLPYSDREFDFFYDELKLVVWKYVL